MFLSWKQQVPRDCQESEQGCFLGYVLLQRGRGDAAPNGGLRLSQATGGMFPDWCEGGPVGATYAATKNGWFTMEKHNQWFKQARVHTYTSTGTGNDTIPAHNGSNRYGT